MGEKTQHCDTPVPPSFEDNRDGPVVETEKPAHAKVIRRALTPVPMSEADEGTET
jgi:hypothetical protein